MNWTHEQEVELAQLGRLVVNGNLTEAEACHTLAERTGRDEATLPLALRAAMRVWREEDGYPRASKSLEAIIDGMR